MINNVPFNPLKEWNIGYSLSWYKDYNIVKHNRTKQFEKANLSNLVNSFCALRIMLFVQYREFSLTNMVSESFIRMIGPDKNGDDSIMIENDSIFDIKYPERKEYGSEYSFDWNSIKNDRIDFNSYYL